MITVKPIGGIGNRLRVISSALALAEQTNHSLRVVWDSNPELNCAYKDLFSPNPCFEIVETSEPLFLRRFNKLMAMFSTLVRLPYPPVYNRTVYQWEIDKRKRQGFNFYSLGRNKSLMIAANGSFIVENNFNRFFLPLPIIQNEVDRIVAQFNEHTVGIHIRRSDNKLSIQVSPLEAFTSRMREILDKEPQAKFFVSTDCLETGMELQEKFGDAIQFRGKECKRDEVEGIQEALVDIICLSKTRYIIGSYWSSFSQIAATLGGVDLVIAKNEN